MNFNFQKTTFSVKKSVSLLLALAFILISASFSIPSLTSYADSLAAGDTSGDASGDAGFCPNVTVDNYYLIVDNAENINAIRIAPGYYTTGTDIKKASGLITLSESLIKSLTENNKCKYELPDGGEYSVWLRSSDGEQYITHISATEFRTYYTVNGLYITFHNLYDVKDIFIATGVRTNYRSVADNKLVMISANKIAGAHNYTYGAALPGAGTYTVLIRKANQPDKISFFSCKDKQPEITFDGLRLKIGNLDKIKVIRLAPGVWSTSREVKSATGSIGYSATSIAKNLDENGIFTYTNSNKKVGMQYTLYVEYYDGYTCLRQYTVQKKQPVFDVQSNSISISSIDDLYIIRYAQGTYTTASQIKSAADSEYIKPESVYGDSVTLYDLSGTYTFLVQYNDSSVNIQTFTFD